MMAVGEFMVEPISTALAGIALVRSSVAFIKDNIDTCKDIGSIMGAIDNVFQGEKEINQKRFSEDRFGVKNVAQEVIDAKLAQEQMYEISQLVDNRFGHGTWQFILAERKKRIDEEKERVKQEKAKKAMAHREMMDNVRLMFIVAGVILVCVIVLFAGLTYAADFGRTYEGKLPREQKYTTCRLIKSEWYEKDMNKRAYDPSYKCTYEHPQGKPDVQITTGPRFNCPRTLSCKRKK